LIYTTTDFSNALPEAISILQKQFNIHLQTIHKMVNDSFRHEKPKFYRPEY